MKLKKFIISASAVAASSGLLATVLTSCAKAKIDDDLKIDLDDTGKFTNTVDFKNAVQAALTRSTSWATFKTALAEEIVYKWYVDRAASDKDSKDKNTSFRTNLDEWQYQIKKDYTSMVDGLKSKYGANYKFYLQNEQLSPVGGSEAAYKHAKLVEKVKDEFVSKAFGTNYFGYAKGDVAKEYPQIFTDVDQSPDVDSIKNPENWNRFGFFARSNPGFTVKDKSDVNLLAKYPDGDFAILQNYVFNRWFRTEKPFFSAAALFKYSNPTAQDTKLDQIYNAGRVTVPENPNEAYPYFGGTPVESNDSYKGGRGFYKWYHALLDGELHEDGKYSEPGQTAKYNQTISIPKKYTEDSQTLLLCYGSQMIGGSANALYIPYGVAASTLYLHMMGLDTTHNLGLTPNIVDQAFITDNVNYAWDSTTPSEPIDEDDSRILNNFFIRETELTNEPEIYGINNYVDLSDLYGTVDTGDGNYHCNLFNKDANFKFFFGNDQLNGVQYITNQIASYLETNKSEIEEQPWMFELNEAGMHAQTIDGYPYVYGSGTSTLEQRTAALKKVLMYRLMQKQCDFDGGIISVEVFGDSGALKTYFNDNFANIVLEMALSDEKQTNIFRGIDTYATETADQGKWFLSIVASDHKLGTLKDLIDYVKLTISFDIAKKNYDADVNASDKIYAYRTTQITNAKSKLGKKIYENGLLAPLVADYKSDLEGYGTTHLYSQAYITMVDYQVNVTDIKDIVKNIKESTFVKSVTSATVNTDAAFSPRIADAKKATSNRFWYASTIVDKMMYSFMADKGFANGIKMDTYKSYNGKAITEKDGFKYEDLYNGVQDGAASTYYASKLLTGDKNIASYVIPTSDLVDVNFITTMQTNYKSYLENKVAFESETCDDAMNDLLYFTTLTYLAKNNFEGFYRTLGTKIAEDEKAFIGYLCKYNTLEPWLSNPEEETTISPVTYWWEPIVANNFDNNNYAGRAQYEKTDVSGLNKKPDFNEYWHVVNKKFRNSTMTIPLAGFLGIQTNSSNILDADSGLKDAAFKDLAKSTYGSTEFTGAGTEQPHAMNDGALFAWAGTKDAAGEAYTFDPVTYDGNTVKAEQFTGEIEPAKKLARKIATSSTIDDLRSMAKSLGSALMGNSVFKRIGNGDIEIGDEDPINQMKYLMLNELIRKENNAFVYAGAFKRIVNTELHGQVTNPFCFENGNDGYKLMITQINKSDVTEKTLTPTFKNGVWSMPETQTDITINEFWYIIANMATESSIQQLAIADAVKTVFGDGKLVVHDAQLYNQFDSVWIKDWEKKPIGADS